MSSWSPKHQQKQNEYRNSHPEWYMHYKAKRRARLKQVEFNIEVSDVVMPKNCPVFKQLTLKKETSEGIRSKGLLQLIKKQKKIAKLLAYCSTRNNPLTFNKLIKETKANVKYFENYSSFFFYFDKVIKKI